MGVPSRRRRRIRQKNASPPIQAESGAHSLSTGEEGDEEAEEEGAAEDDDEGGETTDETTDDDLENDPTYVPMLLLDYVCIGNYSYVFFV